MANQDPQPEVYTTVHDFSVATASGTQSAVSIFTNQANNEEVRVYAVAVDFSLIDAAGNQITSTTDPKFTMPTDFTMALSVDRTTFHPMLLILPGFTDNKTRP